MATASVKEDSATPANDVSRELQQRLSDPRIAEGLNRLLDRVDSIAFAVEAFEGFVARGDVIAESVAETVAELKTATSQGESASQLTAMLNQAPAWLNTGSKLASVSQQAQLEELEKSRIIQRLTERDTLDTLNSLLDKLPLIAMMVESLDGFIRRGDTIAESVAGMVRDLKNAKPPVDMSKLAAFAQSLPKLQEMGEHLLNSGLADDGLPKVINAGVSMINAGMLDKEVVETMGEVGREAVHTFLEVKKQNPPPIGGLWAMMRASKDPMSKRQSAFCLPLQKPLPNTWTTNHARLSIANSLIELVTQQVEQEDLAQVRTLRLRIGALSCVHPDALKFSFGLVAEGTPLGQARLEIETVPVAIYCPRCDNVVSIEGIQSFRCPNCQTASADIRAGRELDLHSIEMDPVTECATEI